MSDSRKIRFRGKELEALDIQRLYQMVIRGNLDNTTEFWSEKNRQWQPLTRILFDFYPSRLDQMREAGITKVEIMGAGNNDDCPACTALQKIVYPIDQVPALPPEGCTCIPWCRSIVLAKE